MPQGVPPMSGEQPNPAQRELLAEYSYALLDAFEAVFGVQLQTGMKVNEGK